MTDTVAGPAAAGSPVQPCPLRIHWVEIELVGEDGQGIADEPYLIIAPDGSEHRGRTDANGVARVDAIPGGNCRVSFTALDQEAWQSA